MYKLHIGFWLLLAVLIFVATYCYEKPKIKYLPKINSVEELEEKFNLLESKFLSHDYKDLKKLYVELKLDLYYNNSYVNNPKIILINQKLDSIKSFLQDINSNSTTNNLKIIAMINIVFLPLSFISGFYGVNFEFMFKKNNIFTYKYGELWLFAFIFIYGCLFAYVHNKLTSEEFVNDRFR